MEWPYLYLTIVLLVQELCGVPVWRWECNQGYCQKFRITPETRNTSLSLPACRLLCLKYAALWPQPTGDVKLGNSLAVLNIDDVTFVQSKRNTSIRSLVLASTKRFIKLLRKLSPIRPKREQNGRSLIISIDIKNYTITKLDLDTNESYVLKVSEASGGAINATLTAPTYFGSRHGLETLGQLILYDDLRDEIQIATNVSITDAPVYSHRGILLDTSRNYITVKAIKRTINGMAASKLNTFHWHITDSHSFPYVSKSQPSLSELGAYSPRKVYTPEDVASIVKFGKIRGVRVMPEFDAPAHVGEGWQDTGFVACLNAQPWQTYCREPPCGQLDPTQPEMYEVLEGIYKDMVEEFEPVVFHMGGDEVSIFCWNSSESLRQRMSDAYGWEPTTHNFMKLWGVFQSKALDRLSKYSGPSMPVIMWTSELTQGEDVEKYLPKNRYIIQAWTSGSDPHISDLLEKGYRLILSNYDALYFDCGFAAWTRDGNNWCSPYIGWQKVYANSPAEIAGARKGQVLGAEACLWSEEADDASVDNRLWPRAAALAERLWAEPNGTWKDAHERMVIQRERLIQRGIAADTLQPEWCLQNEQNCIQGGAFNN